MAQDALGNEVSRASPATLQGIDDFVTGFLGYEKKAANIIAAADGEPDAVLANTYAGFTWMFLEADGAKAMAGTYQARAEAAAAGANERERMLIAQLECWIADDIPAVQAIGDELVTRYPRDLASVKLHQYFSFNRGDAAGMLRIARAAEAANPDNPHIHGMLAFGYEQLHDLETAEREARLALRLKAKEPWAQHALAHVMLGTGRVAEGVAFLAEAQRTWVDLNSFMYTHNWWHKALFHISQGDDAAVFDAFDHHVWGIEPDYSQDQVGAVSLLAPHGGCRHGCRRPLGGCGQPHAGQGARHHPTLPDAAVSLRAGPGGAQLRPTSCCAPSRRRPRARLPLTVWSGRRWHCRRRAACWRMREATTPRRRNGCRRPIRA
jgi:hypothetical protein